MNNRWQFRSLGRPALEHWVESQEICFTNSFSDGTPSQNPGVGALECRQLCRKRLFAIVPETELSRFCRDSASFRHPALSVLRPYSSAFFSIFLTFSIHWSLF